MRIQHNIMAMNAYRNYSNNTSALSKNLEKLSSGYKINRAGDDAAGLAISEKMRAQITGLDKAQDNAKDGISLVQTAEGALTEVHDMLNRMYELANQSANGTYDGTDREQLQKEVAELKDEIDRIADSSNFNGINLLDGTLGGYAMTQGTAVDNGIQSITVSGGKLDAAGTFTANIDAAGKITLSGPGSGSGVTWVAIGTDTLSGKNGGNITFEAQLVGTATQDAADVYEGMTVTVTVAEADDAGDYATTAFTASAATGAQGLTLQIGDTSAKYNQLNVAVQDMHVESLNIDDINIGTQDGAQEAIAKIKNAINTVSSVRGTLGATQNRLDHTINNLSVMQENIQDAESSIRDTDVADEMMAYTKNNILIQSAQAMLAQANQVPQGVLQLLQ
nr:flagellin [uncultured Agathobaculum sp.]